jgi:hypothetical protein
VTAYPALLDATAEILPGVQTIVGMIETIWVPQSLQRFLSAAKPKYKSIVDAFWIGRQTEHSHLGRLRSADVAILMLSLLAGVTIVTATGLYSAGLRLSGSCRRGRKC